MNDHSSEVYTDSITTWLTEIIAKYLRISNDSVLVDSPFAEFGLDSVHALTLIGEIEQYLGLQLDPMLLWDFSTVRELSSELLRIKCEREAMQA